MKIAFLGAYKKYPNTPHWGSAVSAANSLALDCRFYDVITDSVDSLYHDISSYDPDVVVHGLMDGIANGLVTKLPGKQVLWYCDYTFFERGCDNPLKGSCGLDLLMLCNKEQIPLYEKRVGIPVVYLPMAFGPLGETESKSIVLPDNAVHFEGRLENDAVYSERTRFVERLKVHVPFVINDLVQFHDRWNKETAIEAGRHAISLSISATQDAYCYTSPRLFQIPMVGGFPLVANFPGLHEYFPEIATFKANDVDDCVTQINYWLDHPEEREALRLKVHAHALRHHTYVTRLSEMVSILKTLF